MYRNRMFSCGVAGAGLFLGASSAVAGLTPVGPAGAHEATQQQILEHVYGAALSRSGSDYSGANGLSIRRVDDAADKTVTFGAPTRVDLVSTFTDWKWDYSLRDAAGNTVARGTQGGSGLNANGGFNVDAGGKPLQFVLDHGKDHELRSNDAVDQLVTYKVSDASGRDETVFFWEDWTRRQHPSGDFNDLVFRATPAGSALGGAAVEAAPAATASIPLPPAAWPGAVGLVGVAMTAARRYRRR